ncbi:hypothetical protein P4O66_010598, partial [Electrophorus voltai]
GNDVSGPTLGIIGKGRIRYKVAKRAQGFDMKVLYHNRNRSRGVGSGVKVLLQRSDFIIVVVRRSPQTHHLIGAKELAMMKSSGTLINISRGKTIQHNRGFSQNYFLKTIHI